MKFYIFLIISLSLSPLILFWGLFGLLVITAMALIILMDGYLFSYLVFLLFSSGLMVLFMYFCSIINSEKHLNNSDILVGLVFGFMFSLGNSEWGVWLSGEIWSKEVFYEFCNLLKYLVYPYSLLTLLFISYLLVCLLIICEIVKQCGGPLRTKI